MTSTVRGSRRARILAPLFATFALTIAGAAACRDREAAAAAAPAVAAAASSPMPAVVGVVDSAIPIDEALRRFRAGLPEVAALGGGAAPSRDLLVRRFVDAVARRDTAALRAMQLTRGEFAYLYYPATQYVRPPYELDPRTLWFLSREQSDKGLRRVVERVGGRAITLAGYDCSSEPPVRQGPNVIWGRCTVRYRAGADTLVERRLFSGVIERGGAFKFLSYANDF